MPQITPIDHKAVITAKTSQGAPKPQSPAVVDTPIPTPAAAGVPTDPKLSAQNDTTEGNPKPAEATEPGLDPKFATLARKEKTLRQVQKTLQTEREAFQAEKAAFEASKGKQLTLEDLSKNPLHYMAQAGVTYDTLVQKLLGQQESAANPASQVPPIVTTLLERIEGLEAKLTQTQEKQTQSQTKAYEEAVNTLRFQTRELVNSGEAFETIKATNAHEQVVEFIKKVHAEEGIVLSVEAACQQIEDVLLENKLAEYQRLSGTKKWKAKLTPETPQDPKEIVPSQVSGAKSSPSKTLTNAMGNSRPLTAKERAILAFKGQLQKT